MANFLVINDLVQFKLLDPKLVEIKDNFLGGAPNMMQQNSLFSGKKGLIVRLAATHAGIITGNNTFYMPDKMRDGVPSFLENYGKPILTHHNEEKDAIGRVIEARYVDTSKAIRDSQWHGKEVRDSAGRVQGTINDKLLNDFIDGKMPYGQAVDVVRNILDNSVLQDPNYEGLGYAEITAQITDKDAIEKFLDGRYLTGSVSATTDRAVCSHCRQDWTKEGACDHKPGSVIDSKRVYLIAGKFSYSEYSMVNKPADRHSRVLELHYNGVKDSVEIAKDSSRVYEVNVGFPQYEVNDRVQEDELMSAKKKDKASEETPAESKTAEVKDSVTEVTPPVEEKKDEATPPTGEETKVEENKDAKVESFDDFFTRVLDVNYKSTAEDVALSYKLMIDEMQAMGMSDKEIEEIKLSDERLAKLPKSSFVAPERMMPVTDAAHALAARRLVDGYKGTANKDSILATINRKAKALGANGLQDKLNSKDVKLKDSYQAASIMRELLNILETNTYTMPDSDPTLSEEETNSLRSMLKKLAGMVGKDSIAKAAGLEKLGLDASTEKTFCDEITSLEEVVGNLRDELNKITEEKNAIKEEYDTLFNEMNALQDSVVQLKTSARTTKLARLNMLNNLKDGEVKDRAESFATLTDQVIDDQLAVLDTEVDMNKIVVKLNDGMSRVPSGEVKNPAEVINDGKPKVSTEAVKAELANIEGNFVKLSMKDKAAAERYLEGEINRLRNEGKLPKKG